MPRSKPPKKRAGRGQRPKGASGYTLDPGQRRKATQMDAILARLKGWERPKYPVPSGKRPYKQPGRKHKL